MLPDSLQNELIAAAIFVQLDRKPVEITDTHWSFSLAEPHIFRLMGEGYIEIVDDHYHLTSEGRKSLQKTLAALDQVRKFEIFSNVYFVPLPVDILMIDELGVTGLVKDHVFDPRFHEEMALKIDNTAEPEDVRLAMISYMLEAVEKDRDEEFDNYSSVRIIFLQKLLDEEFTGDFWGGLFSGQFLRLCEEIADSQLRWFDLVSPDEAETNGWTEDEAEEEAWERAGFIYNAGMLEVKKQNGHICGTCEAPIALMENHDEGGNLICDSCGSSFYEEPPTEYDLSCPNCSSAINPGATNCPGCGLHIDYALQPGDVVETTTTTSTYEDEEEEWDCWDDDVYLGYPMYDPYDPLVDALAFAIVCDVIF